MRTLLHMMRINKFFILSLLLISLPQFISGQCTNTFSFGTAVAPSNASTVTISTCVYRGDYSTISGVVAGASYQVNNTSGGCITIHQGSYNGPVVGFGTAPLTWTATAAGTYYVHYNTNCVTCGTASGCGTATISCVSCGGGGSYNPCSSITALAGCGTSVTATMSGSGAGWSNLACGYSTPGTEMIFSFTPTTSGTHSIDVTSATGGFVNFSWKLASSGCSSGGWNCIDDIFMTGNYGNMSWIAGQTYYILIDPEGTGAYSYTFNVDCPNPGGPITAGDCFAATSVCTNLNFSIDPNGYGLVNELCTGCFSNPSTNPASGNAGCLLSGELNSTWFLVNVAGGGTMEFAFGAPGNGYCFDWAMWPYTPTTCAQISSNTLAPVRCNWNTMCDGYTGIAGTVPPGGYASEFEPPLAVTTGQQYIICFSNWGSAVTDVPMVFTGSSNINCITLPVELLNFEGREIVGGNELKWTTGSEFNNSHFDLERSLDGTNFTKIGTVEGGGTVIESSEYRFVDNNPGTEVNYYRLRQVNYDGQEKVSSTISIVSSASTQMRIISAFPNPADDIFTLKFNLPERSEIEISLSKLNGTSVMQWSDVYDKGSNQVEVKLNALLQGMYFIRLRNPDSGESEMLKLMVR